MNSQNISILSLSKYPGTVGLNISYCPGLSIITVCVTEYVTSLWILGPHFQVARFAEFLLALKLAICYVVFCQFIIFIFKSWVFENLVSLNLPDSILIFKKGTKKSEFFNIENILKVILGRKLNFDIYNYVLIACLQ